MTDKMMTEKTSLMKKILEDMIETENNLWEFYSKVDTTDLDPEAKKLIADSIKGGEENVREMKERLSKLVDLPENN